MKKVFIFWICGECGEPIDIVRPCYELGYNAFGQTNFHGEMSVEKTEDLRNELIQKLRKKGDLENARMVELYTKVLEVQFLNFTQNQK